MLDALELAAARKDANLLLPSTAVVRRVVTTPDGGGGRTRQAPQDQPPVQARLVTVGGGEQGTGGGRVTRGNRVSDRTTHILTLPAETVVSERDEVLIDGTLYEVTAVLTRNAEEIVRRVEVREAG